MCSLVHRLDERVGEMEKAKEKWDEHRMQLIQNQEAVHASIDHRHKKILKYIDKYVKMLHEKADAMIGPRLERAEHVLADMDHVLKEIQRFTEYSSVVDKHEEHDTDHLKGELQEMRTKLDVISVDVPQWKPVKLSHAHSLKQMMTSLFGSLEGGNGGSGWLNGLDESPRDDRPSTSHASLLLNKPQAWGSDAAEESKENGAEEQEAPDDLDPEDDDTDTMLIRPLNLIKAFNCKAHKDKLPCGLTDIAMTTQNQVLVVDRNNKLVKQFSASGQFEKYIGLKLVKDPTRVSVIRGSGQILVSDSSAKDIKIFRKDGTYISEFGCGLKYPTSHCNTQGGNIAVLEFDTKSVHLCDANGKMLHKFATSMTCPAYISSTKDGTLVITDWREKRIKMFSLRGEELFSYKSDGGKSDILPLPHGVVADRYGHILITEKQNHCVQVLADNGAHIHCYNQQKHDFKLPMALATNDYDLIAVAEYQGTVKLFRYLDLSKKRDSTDGLVPVKGVVVPEEVEMTEAEAAC